MPWAAFPPAAPSQFGLISQLWAGRCASPDGQLQQTWCGQCDPGRRMRMEGTGSPGCEAGLGTRLRLPAHSPAGRQPALPAVPPPPCTPGMGFACRRVPGSAGALLVILGCYCSPFPLRSSGFGLTPQPCCCSRCSWRPPCCGWPAAPTTPSTTASTTTTS